MQRFKYPRTPHLPWSQSTDSSDLRLEGVQHFAGKEIVITEKMDGENTTIYADGYVHARSIDSKHHESRSRVKALAAQIAPLMSPLGIARICGENLTAVHTLRYNDLPAFFLVFSIWTKENFCYDWDSTKTLCTYLGLTTPRILYRGVFENMPTALEMFDDNNHEGYVIRTTKGFAYEDFGKSVAKWVNPRFRITDTHWTKKAIEENIFETH